MLILGYICLEAEVCRHFVFRQKRLGFYTILLLAFHPRLIFLKLYINKREEWRLIRNERAKYVQMFQHYPASQEISAVLRRIPLLKKDKFKQITHSCCAAKRQSLLRHLYTIYKKRPSAVLFGGRLYPLVTIIRLSRRRTKATGMAILSPKNVLSPTPVSLFYVNKYY